MDLTSKHESERKADDTHKYQKKQNGGFETLALQGWAKFDQCHTCLGILDCML